MAYVTLEDDTAAIEMLAFSNVLSQYGNYLRENEPLVITGRLSFREDKDAQIVVNRVRPMTDFSQNNVDTPMQQPAMMQNMRKAGSNNRIFVFITILPSIDYFHFTMTQQEMQEGCNQGKSELL